MKKILLICVVLLLLVIAWYFAVCVDPSSSNQYTTYNNPELGIEFKYRVGPQGYVLQELIPGESVPDLLRTIMLVPTEDTLDEPPVGGEGPASINIYAFRNTSSQSPRVWADTHIQYSNINLVIGSVAETVVGSSTAIRYRADGLYASDNVVVVEGDTVYLFTGQFMDEESNLRRDFQPILDSVRFL